MKKFVLAVTLIACSVILPSCTTYYIPVESFKEQFAGLDSIQKKSVVTEGPLGGQKKYGTYPIDYILAIDKNGNTVRIANSPSIEIRITDTAGNKSIFYFDKIKYDGELITGNPSRIISTIHKSIPIGSVKTIEVQNGRKNYRYVQ